MSGQTTQLERLFGRLICFLGFHDDALVEADFGFGPAGNTARYRCRRCGRVKTTSQE